LSPSERKLFLAIVNGCAENHFRDTDMILLCRYVEAGALAEQAALEMREHGAVIDGKTSPWLQVQEKTTRALTALSMRLRLSPQSRKPFGISNRSEPRLSYYEAEELNGSRDHG
jgi:phage terminase small subunit